MTVRYCALTAANWPSASEIGRSSAVGPAFQGRCIFRHLGIWASGHLEDFRGPRQSPDAQAPPYSPSGSRYERPESTVNRPRSAERPRIIR